MNNAGSLIFSTSPAVTLCTNHFINVETILQYDDTPLIQILKNVDVGYQMEIPIFHNDGVKLATIKGSRIFLTEAGKKANLVLEHPDKMTVCKLSGKTIFEIKRDAAAAISVQAELNTQNGYFIKLPNSINIEMLSGSGKVLQIGGLTMSDCVINGGRIGIWMKSDGSISIGG